MERTVQGRRNREERWVGLDASKVTFDCTSQKKDREKLKRA